MKIAGLFALAAAAATMPLASATAADLGESCCADLEQRVAELEATTVRKGNRKVSLELSGQVDRALLFWDDGKDADVYSVDNAYSTTRFRMKGQADMVKGWKAGFYMEIEFRDASSSLVSQLSETGGRGTDSSTGALRLRQSNAFVESEKLGRVTLGLQNMATKDITLISLGGALSDAENWWATSFRLRNSAGDLSALTWGNFWNAIDALRAELVRYDTPSLYGFILSTSWGQNDIWDIALRYLHEWETVRVAAGVGYAWYGENFCGGSTSLVNNVTSNGACQVDNVSAQQVLQPDGTFPLRSPGTKTEVISGSISAMHIPTGIYVDVAAGTRHFTNPAFAGLVANKDANYVYIQAGITKRFFDVGATTFYGEFGDYSNFAVGDVNDLGGGGLVESDDVTRWGVGVTQAFDSAALELYTNYLHMNTDFRSSTGATPSVEDMNLVLTGARLKF